MPSAWDSFRELLWAELKKLDARRASYIAKIVQASASTSSTRGRVLVSGIDETKNVLLHPSMILDDQIRALGNSAIGRDVLVQSIGGQYYGVTIQLTGETQW